LGVGELGQVHPQGLIAKGHLARDDLGGGCPEGLEGEEERAGGGHQRLAAAAGARRGCHGFLAWCVCGCAYLCACVALTGWGCVCRSHAPRGIDAGLCVCMCGWREREEAGISKCERVGCRGGVAYVWLERRLARSKSFLPSFDGAIQEKRDRDEKKKLAAQGTKGPLKCSSREVGAGG